MSQENIPEKEKRKIVEAGLGKIQIENTELKEKLEEKEKRIQLLKEQIKKMRDVQPDEMNKSTSSEEVVLNDTVTKILQTNNLSHLQFRKETKFPPLMKMTMRVLSSFHETDVM